MAGSAQVTCILVLTVVELCMNHVTAAVVKYGDPGRHVADGGIKLCQGTYWRTAMTCVVTKDGFPAGTILTDEMVFVKTGDIPEMWIRDSSAQVNNYFAKEMQWIPRGLILAQAAMIEHAPYANSYRMKPVSDRRDPNIATEILGRTGHVGTYNYEPDSGAYFFRLVKKYWKESGELLEVGRATMKLLETYITEQEHRKLSKYRYKELPEGGIGTKVNESTGLTWGPYRASDDPTMYGYHIPDNLFIACTLNYVLEFAKAWDLPHIGLVAKKLQADIREGLKNHATTVDSQYGKIYCYEVDGFGNCNKMDDANIPSLIAIPYLDPEGLEYDKEVYENTRKFVLSPSNRFYNSGKIAMGIGSQHTPQGMIWHMGMIMEALTDTSRDRKEEIFQNILKTTGDWMHEGFDPNYPSRFTRPWFTWPDSLFTELCFDLGKISGIPPKPEKMDNKMFFY